MKNRRAPSHEKIGKEPHRFLRTLGLVVLGVALVFSAVSATVYSHLQSNIKQNDIDDLIVASDRPSQDVAPLDQKSGQPINILLIGSDARTGTSGTISGMRSDTTMVAHVSADRTRVDVVSIPRDTLIDIPPCELGNGKSSYNQYDAMFNSAFSTGGLNGSVAAGAACTLKTVESMSDIFIDGYAVVDFTSFKEIVDILGGIEMCFNEDLKDKQAELDLQAGCQNLNGQQALAVSRARKHVGDGSDISRITRQHEVVNAIIKRIMSMNIYTDIPQMYSMLRSVTTHMETSEGVGSIPVLSGLMYSLKDLKSENINFKTMPFAWAGNRVRPTSNSDVVWEALRNDQPIPEDAFTNQLAQNTISSASIAEREKAESLAGMAVRISGQQ